MKSLAFFPADLPVSPERHAYFESFGYRAEPFRPERSDVPLYLLATPAKVPALDAFVAADGVWQRYLRKKSGARLLRTGLFSNDAAKNYINWLQPPDDLVFFLEQCGRVEEEIFPRLGLSERLETVWTRFWDGHDKNGFSYHFTDLLMAVQVVENGLVRKGEEYALKTKDDLLVKISGWTEKVRRSWERYEPYFNTSPFLSEFSEVDRLLSVLPAERYEELAYRILAETIPVQVKHLTDAQTILRKMSPFFKVEKP